MIVILDDLSTDGWETSVAPFLADPRVVVLKANCGSAAKARNALLDWVDEHLPAAVWIARLDADDRFACTEAVAALVKAGEWAEARFVLGSNHLERGGVPQPYSNIADPGWLHHPRPFVSATQSRSCHPAICCCAPIVEFAIHIRRAPRIIGSWPDYFSLSLSMG